MAKKNKGTNDLDLRFSTLKEVKNIKSEIATINDRIATSEDKINAYLDSRVKKAEVESALLSKSETLYKNIIGRLERRAILDDQSLQKRIAADKLADKRLSTEEAITTFIQDQKVAMDPQVQANQDILKAMEKRAEQQKKNEEFFGAFKDKWDDFVAIAQDPKIATGAFIAAWTNEGMKFGDTLRGAGAEIGMSTDQSIEMAGSLAGASISAGILGIGAEKMAAAYTGLAAEMGGTANINADMAKDVAKMAKTYNMTGAEAAKLFRVTSNMSGESAATAKSSLQHVENLARGAGVPIGAVMADVANSADLIAEYGYDNVDALGKAAVEAAKMGTSLDQMAKTADKLMDIDNARNDAMQLSVMLGRNINIDRAQQLIYAGDLQGGYKEMLNQLGGIQGFNQMDYYQKKQAAAMLGISTGELQKQLNLAAGLTETGEKQPEGWAKTAAWAQDIMKYGKENMTTIAATLNVVGAIGNSKLGQYVAEKAHMMWKKAFGGGGVPGAGGPLKADGTPDMRFKANKNIMKDMKSQNDTIQKVNKPGPKGDNAIVSFFKGFKKVDWSSIFKAVAAMALMGVALLAFVPPFMLFSKIPVKGILGGIGTLVAMTMAMKVIGKASGEIMKGSFGLLLMGVALLPAAYAFTLIAGVPMGAMWNFAAVLTVLGLAFAGIGYLGTLPIGALGLLIMAPAMIGIAFAFQMVAGLPMGEMWNFAAVLTVLGLAFAGIGFLPTIFVGALGLLAMVPGVIGMAFALSFTKGLDPATIAAFGVSVLGLGLATAALGLVGPMAFMGAMALLAMIPGIIGIAYALSWTEGLDPVTILAFGSAVSMLGITMAAMGLTGPLIMMGALGLMAMVPGIIGIAYALSWTEGLDAKTILAFATTVGLLGVTMAGLGLAFPFLALGSLGMIIMAPGILAISMAFQNLPKDLDIVGFATGLGMMALVGLALIPAAGGILLFSVSLGALALALYALTPVLGTLSMLVSIGGQFAALLGFGKEENEDGETSVKANVVNVNGSLANGKQGGLEPVVAEEEGMLGALKRAFLRSTEREAEAMKPGGQGLRGKYVEDRTQSQLADEIVKKIGQAEFKVFLDGKKVNKALYNPAGT